MGTLPRATASSRQPSPHALLVFAWKPALLIALAAIGVRVAVLLLTRATHEDFLITLRYAENLSAGKGFAYNPGERVLGTTTPLYSLLLALGIRFGMDGALLGKVVNIFADGAVCYVLALLGHTLRRPQCGLIAALLYAMTSAPINFSTGGMETGLVTLVGLLGLLAYLHGNQTAMGLSLGLLVFARIDGLALAAVLLLAWTKVHRRPPWRSLALTILVPLPWVVFALIYFGSPVPDSMISKLLVYRHARTGVLPNLDELNRQFAGGPAQAALLLSFLAGFAASWRAHAALRPAWMWLFVYYAVLLSSRVPAFGWYFVPPLPLYYFTSALGASALIRSVRVAPAPPLRIAAMLCLAVLLAARIPGIVRDISTAHELEERVRVPLGLWLRERMTPGERLMLEPIGTIGYYSRGRVLDVIGLVSPEVRDFYKPGIASPLRAIAVRYRPEWMALRSSELAEVLDSATEEGRMLSDAYRQVAAFPAPPERPTMVVLRRIQPDRIREEKTP